MVQYSEKSNKSKMISSTMMMAALLMSEGVFGFGPRLKQAAVFGRKPSTTPTRVFSSTLPDQQEDKAKTNGAGAASSAADLSKQTGLEALERLLARQQAEIEETKRLMELYESIGSQGGIGGRNSTTMDEMMEEGTNPQLLSVASTVMKGYDYGFRSRSEGPTFDLKGGNAAFIGYGPPANLLSLGSQQFMRNLKAMKNEYDDEVDMSLTKDQVQMQKKLQKLTLNSTAIWERELKDGPIEAPLLIKVPYLFLCWMLDVVFEGRYVPGRFFLLETVARMPYFSYIAMLHLYETLGFWRRSADVKRIHFAEEMNEFRHLLIMESLGGDQRWWVRFMAQHSAIAYYIGLCALFWISPSLSYKFSELLETHAVNTYSQFLDENEELLKELPPSLAAVDYYALGASDPYYAEFQTTAITNKSEIRRPGLNMKSMYDVFSAIRDDEGDHVGTMEACLDPTVAKLSPSLERKVLTGIATAAAIAAFAGTDIADLAGTVDEGAAIGNFDSLVDAAIAAGGALASQGASVDGGEESLSLLDKLTQQGLDGLGSSGLDALQGLDLSGLDGLQGLDGMIPELQNFLVEVINLLSRFI